MAYNNMSGTVTGTMVVTLGALKWGHPFSCTI